MSEIPDVTPGADVESTWGNLIKDRTLMRYSSQANLGGSIPTPSVGDFAYVVDEAAVKVWTGAAWDALLDASSGDALFLTPAEADAAYLALAGGTMSGALLGAVGTTLLPGFAFAGDPDTGMFRLAANTVSIATNGSEVIRFEGDQSIHYINFGSAAQPAFSWQQDNDTGMYRDSANSLAFAQAGAEVARFTATNLSLGGSTTGSPLIRHLAGAVGSPTYSFSGDSDSGLYRVSADVLGLVAGGNQQVRITATRPIGTPGDWPTSGSAANLLSIDEAGIHNIFRSTSAKKYKTDIKSLVTKARPEFLDVDLRPVSFKHKGDGDNYLGFIADEVAEIDPRLGVFNDDGGIENYDLRGVVAILAAQVNDLRARVKTLETS